MKMIAKKIILILTITIIFVGSQSMAQNISANQLALHNGADCYMDVTGTTDHASFHGSKCFPDYCHWAAEGVSTDWFPWRIRGWAWTAVKVSKDKYSDYVDPQWTFMSGMKYITNGSDPYNPTKMSWPYPRTWCGGATPPSQPNHLSYGSLPSSLPSVYSDQSIILPSSYGGYDEYMNIMAIGYETWTIPSTLPEYAFTFQFITSSQGDDVTYMNFYQNSNTAITIDVWPNVGPASGAQPIPRQASKARPVIMNLDIVLCRLPSVIRNSTNNSDL